MTWLDRVGQKNFTPHALVGAKSARRPDGNPKNLEAYDFTNAKSDKSLTGFTSGTFGTAGTKGSEVFVEAPQRQPPEAIIVAYQRIWFDYDFRDGTYTPAELHQAKLLVKRGPVLRYRLRWLGGTPQPRSESDAVGAPALEAK